MQRRKPRVKQHHSKVRTGCLTCKTRHVKCDETRPICIRCSKGGYRCEGFKDPPKAWIFEYSNSKTSIEEEGESSNSKEGSASSDLSPSLQRSRSSSQDEADQPAAIRLKQVRQNVEFLLQPTGPYQTSDEQRALKRFLETIVPLLTRYSDPEVWAVAIPQSSWGHNAMRNSLIAAALVLEDVERQTRTRSRNSRVIIHINAALRSLLEDKPPIEIVIMTGIVLQFLETMDHHPRVALMHLRSTDRILQEYKAKTKEAPQVYRAQADFIINTLGPVVEMALKFAQVTLEQQIEASRLDQHTLRAYETRKMLTRKGLLDRFRNVTDARNNAGAQAVKVVRDMARTIPHTSSELVFEASEALREPLHRIQLSSEAYHDTMLRLGHCERLYSPIHDPSGLENQMLVIHFKILKMMVEDVKPPTANLNTQQRYALFDVHDLDDLISESIALASNPTIQAVENFKIELGLIPPLFYFATSNRSCRPASRMKAVHCLLSQLAHRREGIWTGAIAGRVAEEIFDLRTRVGYENELFNVALKVDYPEDKEAIKLGSASPGTPQLWVRYQMATIASSPDLKIDVPVLQTHFQRCISWTAEEVNQLPKNINVLIQNAGYQGYFSEAIAAAKQV